MSEEKALSFYWELASTNEVSRLKAARELVGFLTEAQHKYVETGSEDDDKPYCSELDYSLKRLSKGLASSRKGARQGFATVLAEILHQFDCITADDVVQLLAENLQVTGNAKSQEERDAYIGHVFGLMSLVRAQDLDVMKNVEDCEWLKQVTETLKQLTEKKSYLQELGVKSMVDIISMVSFEVFMEYIEPVIKDYIYDGWESATPPSLLIALAVEKEFRGQIDDQAFKNAWEHIPLINAKNYSKIAEVLQESTIVHPRIHCVWDEVLTQVSQRKSADLETFWTTVVDDGLFQSTHERKYLGFQLIAKILPDMKADQVSTVFSKNVIRSFINNLSSTQSYLHKAAKHLASTMPSALASNSDPEAAVAVVMQLLGSHGNLSFDKLTKTKTVESLLGKVQGDGLVKLVSWFIRSFLRGSTDDQMSERPSAREVDAMRTTIFNQLLSLTKTKSLSRTGSWLQNVMFFLVEQSYFKAVTGEMEVPLSSQVRDICEQRFLSAMKELDSHTSQAQEPKKSGKDDELNLMNAIVKHVKDLLASKEFTILSTTWSDLTQKAFDNAVKVIMKIHKKQSKESTQNPEDKAFELLLSHVTLQLFTEPDQAVDILKEVRACYKNRQEKDASVSTEEPHWVEVLTEILLSLLTRPSGLIRHVVDQVFVAIAPHLTKDALAIILQAIDPKSLGGDDDEVLEITEDSGDEEMNAADEAASDENKKESEDDESNDDDSDDEESDDEEENRNDVDEAFRAEIKAALGSAAVNMEEEEESSDDDMDDETVMQLDDALSAVFKTRVQANKDKKNKKDTTKSILHFKLRVLDVIEIFIKKQPHNPLVLDLVEPLLSLAWSTLGTKDYQTLGERAQAIYRNKLCSIREHPSAADVDSDDLHTRIETLIHKAMKAPSLNIVGLVARGCMLLIRVLRGSTHGNGEPNSKKRKHEETPDNRNEQVGSLQITRVAAVFTDALKDFMEKRSTHLHPILFMELINRFPSVAWELAPQLIQALEGAVNNFRKTQACTMLTQLLSHKCPGYGKHLKSNAAALQETLRTIITSCADPDTQLKAKHFREVLKLTTKFIKEGNTAEQVVTPALLTEALQSALEGPLASRSQDIKSTCSRLITQLEGSIGGKATPAKRKKTKENIDSNGHSKDTAETEQSSKNNKSAEQKQKKRKKKKDEIK